MDLTSLIKAYLIAQGSHTGGHFYQASNPSNPLYDTPMRLDAKNLVEEWSTSNNQKATDIHGAGFSMQDRMRDLIQDPETQQNVSRMNALIKGFYLSGGPNKLSDKLIPGGDIGGMERSSGNPYVRALLTASILSDLVKSKGLMKNKSLDFTTINGAPGLKFNMEF